MWVSELQPGDQRWVHLDSVCLSEEGDAAIGGDVKTYTRPQHDDGDFSWGRLRRHGNYLHLEVSSSWVAEIQPIGKKSLPIDEIFVRSDLVEKMKKLGGGRFGVGAKSFGAFPKGVGISDKTPKRQMVAVPIVDQKSGKVVQWHTTQDKVDRLTALSQKPATKDRKTAFDDLMDKLYTKLSPKTGS